MGKWRSAIQAEEAEEKRQQEAAATKARIRKEEEARARQILAQETRRKFWNR